MTIGSGVRPSVYCLPISTIETGVRTVIVDDGTVFARVDGDRLVANWPFVPILFDGCGVEGIVGYRGIPAGDSMVEARAGLRPDTLG
ncbi:hypothetical protein [Natronomonas sp. LN261]|uniref:hypothetical protein n=1 Tax=Natronomonas sp. LN261 TaxID=2750669 RepID=UPI0015EEF4DE|nr:hypothetical protein [Natronomonas sp. LN261]